MMMTMITQDETWIHNFKRKWIECVVGVYLSDYKMSVDQTPLPSYMNRLLEILVEEEQESEADGVTGAVGPCMEYMLQHRILDTMYTFARTDVCHFTVIYFTSVIVYLTQYIPSHAQTYVILQLFISRVSSYTWHSVHLRTHRRMSFYSYLFHECLCCHIDCCHASTSSGLCSFTDASMVRCHGIFPTTSHSNCCHLQSLSASHLVIRCTQLSTVGDCAFPVAGSRLWNSLPPDVTSAPTLTVFGNRLKTYLFSRSFPS